MKNNLEDLLSTLESVRKEKHPEIPSDLIRNIAQTVFENQEDPIERNSLIEALINEYVKKNIG